MNRSTPHSSAAWASSRVPAHVVLDGLARILLHQRHVLVRRRVEDDLGFELTHHLFDTNRIGDVADHRVQAEPLVRILELDTNRVQAVLVALEHHQRGRLEPGNLPAQLGPDGSAGAGHHDATASDQVLERRRVEANGCAGEQVLDRQVPDFRQRDLAVDHVAQRRQRLDRHLEPLERANDGANRHRIGVRNRQEDFLRAVSPQDRWQVGARADDQHAMNPQPDLRLVIVDEPDRVIAVRGARLHVAHDQLAGITGTEDQHPLARMPPRQFGQQPLAHAHGAEQEHQQQRIDDEHRSRVNRWTERSLRQEEEQPGAHADAADQRLKVVQAGVPPDTFVQAEGHEDERAHGDEPWEHLPERLVPKGRYIAVESQQERDPVRRDHQRKLNRDGERPLQTLGKEPQCGNALSHGPSPPAAPARGAHRSSTASMTRACSDAVKAEPLGRQSPCSKSRRPTSPPRTWHERKTGCRCIGFQTGRDSMFRDSRCRRISSRVVPSRQRVDHDARQPRIRIGRSRLRGGSRSRRSQRARRCTRA